MTPRKNSCKENTRSKEWVVSSSSREDLEEMVMDGTLPDDVTAVWRPVKGERLPNPCGRELVVFEDFYRRGFGLPAHLFMRKLLAYYGISLVHLNPNSTLHLSIFINLCEAYLGIEPHFNLFRYFFHLKSFSGANLVGATYLVLWDRKVSEYKLVPFSTSNKGWKSKWFYTKNTEDGLSTDIDSPATSNPNWSAKPSSDEMQQVEELLNLLNRVNINGVECMQNFIGQRIQPCKERSHPAYEHWDADFMREAPEPLINEEIDRRVSKFFTIKKSKEKRHP